MEPVLQFIAALLVIVCGTAWARHAAKAAGIPAALSVIAIGAAAR